MSTVQPKLTKQEEAKAVAITSALLQAVCELTDDWAISAPQVQLLLQLRIHGSIAQQELPKYTGVQKSANSRNIAKLGIGSKPPKGVRLSSPGPGYVESVPDMEDRRLQVVRLTQRGARLIEDAAMRAAAYL